MAKATTANQQAYVLISLYSKLYTEKYNQAPVINRYREKWGFQDMIEDLGYDGAQRIIQYYFTISTVGHPLNNLLYNYEKLEQVRREVAEDKENRLRLREQTRIRVEEWEAKNGNN